VARVDVIVLIPESTRKRSGGSPDSPNGDTLEGVLPAAERRELEVLRQRIIEEGPRGTLDAGRFMPAYERFAGNMYRNIPREAWDQRSSAVEVVIASALRGLVASRDPIPAYHLSMAESTPPFGKLNRWWHAAGLPRILAAYLMAVQPKTVVDLLSLEYRESVAGYENRVPGVAVRRIDFPGMGRASQPRRGEKVAEILQSGKA
jgi:hypothetical protein